MGIYTCKYCNQQFTHTKFKNTCSDNCLKRLRRQTQDINFIKDDEFTHYITGLIFGDGCLTTTGKKIPRKRIILALKDKEMIEYIRHKICPHRKIYEKKPLKSTHSYSYYIETRNDDVIEYFESIGLVQRKSLTLKYPVKYMENNQDTIHFIRGYFDANGCFFKNIVNGHVYIHSSITSGSMQFAEGLNEVLNRFGINSRVLQDSRGQQSYYIKFYSVADIQKFSKLIYDNSTIYLERKKLIVNDFL